MTTNPQTREEWLRALTGQLAPMFTAAGVSLPAKLRVSVGWPSSKALGKRRSLAQCFSPAASMDKHTEIFISPFIGKALDAAVALVHELCHAAVGVQHQHKKPFAALARAMGLEGPLTATSAGKGLKLKLGFAISKVGPFPHATLDINKLKRMKQTTRMIKVACQDCGYTVRTTQKWLEMGCPVCPCGTCMEEAG